MGNILSNREARSDEPNLERGGSHSLGACGGRHEPEIEIGVVAGDFVERA